MKDPLDIQGAERELFEEVVKLVVGKPMNVALVAGINLIVNAIRQSTAQRKDAEAMLDELFGVTKTKLLDVHYDSVTGLRRSVYSYTQVIQMPFHDEGNVIFHGR
jgi:hypothetical protein